MNPALSVKVHINSVIIQMKVMLDYYGGSSLGNLSGSNHLAYLWLSEGYPGDHTKCSVSTRPHHCENPVLQSEMVPRKTKKGPI